MDSFSCRESCRLADLSTESEQLQLSRPPRQVIRLPSGQRPRTGTCGVGRLVHRPSRKGSASPQSAGQTGCRPLWPRPELGAGCGGSCTGSGGAGGLDPARGNSIWTRGQFAQRASPRGRPGLSGRGQGKAPRAVKTPPTPVPQRGAKPVPRTFARERGSSPPSPLGGRLLPRCVESLATILGSRAVTALQPSCEGTT